MMFPVMIQIGNMEASRLADGQQDYYPGQLRVEPLARTKHSFGLIKISACRTFERSTHIISVQPNSFALVMSNNNNNNNNSKRSFFTQGDSSSDDELLDRSKKSKTIPSNVDMNANFHVGAGKKSSRLSSRSRSSNSNNENSHNGVPPEPPVAAPRASEEVLRHRKKVKAKRPTTTGAPAPSSSLPAGGFGFGNAPAPAFGGGLTPAFGHHHQQPQQHQSFSGGSFGGAGAFSGAGASTPARAPSSFGGGFGQQQQHQARHLRLAVVPLEVHRLQHPLAWESLLLHSSSSRNHP